MRVPSETARAGAPTGPVPRRTVPRDPIASAYRRMSPARYQPIIRRPPRISLGRRTALVFCVRVSVSSRPTRARPHGSIRLRPRLCWGGSAAAGLRFSNTTSTVYFDRFRLIQSPRLEECQVAMAPPAGSDPELRIAIARQRHLGLGLGSAESRAAIGTGWLYSKWRSRSRVSSHEQSLRPKQPPASPHDRGVLAMRRPKTRP